MDGWGVVAAVAVVLGTALAVAWTRRKPSPTLPTPAGHGPKPPRPSEPNWFEAALGRTRALLGARIAALRETAHDGRAQALEDVLLQADVGLKTAQALVARAGAADDPVEAIRRELRALLGEPSEWTFPTRPGPLVVMIVGVNGSGKTTTIGKLARRWTNEGKRVLIGAADTFRAAATEQVAVWAERAGADLVRAGEGADPGAVAYDATSAGVARGMDVVLIDTAGRLQTARPLMDELSKVRRAMNKARSGAPDEVWLVLDGTVGQNAISQALAFHEATALTGVIVTKLDGTAKGGAVVAVAHQTGLPIRWLGLGERAEDLRPFDRDAFVDAILGPKPSSAVSHTP